jgi:hypothetical protein
MATYVVLTRLTPETVKTPHELKRLEKAVSEAIRREHAETETWTALPWERFEGLIPT